MSPSRHDPKATPPNRPRRVAGLRKPGEEARPSPAPRPRQDVPGSADERADVADVAAPSGEPEVPESSGEPEVPESSGEPEVPGSAATSPPATSTEPEARAEHGTDDVTTGEPEAAAAKPGPRGKPQNTGARKPTGQDALAEAVPPGTPPQQVSGTKSAVKQRKGLSRRGSYVLAAVLLVLAGAFGTGAVYAKQQYQAIAEATDNAALLDVSRTQQVKKAMMRAAEKLFSYDYRNIEKTQQAAEKLLASKEVQHTYNMLMSEVKRLAPKQKIVVNVTATEAAVLRLHGDRARVMVFVDQISTRTKTGQSTSGGAALWLQAELRNGTWKVVAMNTYSTGAPIKSDKQEQKDGAKPSGSSTQPSGSTEPSEKPSEKPSKSSGN